MHDAAGGFGTIGSGGGGGGGALGSPHFLLPQQHHQQFQHHNNVQQQAALLYNSTPPLNIAVSSSSTSSYVNASSFRSFVVQDHGDQHHRAFAPSRLTGQALLRDNGLLEDIVPTQMRKEEKEHE